MALSECEVLDQKQLDDLEKKADYFLNRGKMEGKAIKDLRKRKIHLAAQKLKDTM